MTPDAWLDAARALRMTALHADGIVGLSHSAAFQTCGRGRAVYGVCLRAQGPDRVRADVGLILTASAGGGERLDGAFRSVAARLHATWDRTTTDRDTGLSPTLDLWLHVFDVHVPFDDPTPYPQARAVAVPGAASS